MSCIPRPDLVHHAAPLYAGARLEGNRVALLSPGLDVVYRPEERVLCPHGVHDPAIDYLLCEDRVGPVPQSEGPEGQRALLS